MLAARSTFGSGGGWQPDPRASLGLAFGAAAVLCLAFLGLLYRPVPGTRPALLTLSVIHAPRVQSAPRRAGPRLATPATVLPPALAPLPPIPGFTLLQEQVDQAVRDTVLGRERGPFLVPPAQQYDELDRALRRAGKPWSLRQGESYRSINGDTIVKSGGGCAAMHEVQVTPGGAKAMVGLMVPCPGEDQPSMASELAQWAGKRAEANPPP